MTEEYKRDTTEIHDTETSAGYESAESQPVSETSGTAEPQPAGETAAAAEPQSEPSQESSDAESQPSSQASGANHAEPDSKPKEWNSEDSGLSLASLILGILGICLSWMFIGIPMAILAIIFGGISLKRRQGERGMAIAGLVLGIVTMVFVLAGFFLLALIFSLAVAYM